MKEIKTSENRLNKFDIFFLPNDVYVMGSCGKQYNNNKRGLCGLRHIARTTQKKLQKQNRGYRQSSSRWPFETRANNCKHLLCIKGEGWLNQCGIFFSAEFPVCEMNFIRNLLHYVIASTRNKGMWWHQPHYRCWYLLTLTNYTRYFLTVLMKPQKHHLVMM